MSPPSIVTSTIFQPIHPNPQAEQPRNHPQNLSQYGAKKRLEGVELLDFGHQGNGIKGMHTDQAMKSKEQRMKMREGRN